MKKLIVIFCISFFLIIFGLFSFTQIFSAESQWFLANIQKYTTNNIQKNTGWRKTALEMISAVADTQSGVDVLHARNIESLYQSLIQTRKASLGIPTVLVKDAKELKKALEDAVAGDIIEMFPTQIDIKEKFKIKASGESDKPIIIRGSSHGVTTLNVSTLVGIEVAASNIVIENINFEGRCKDDSYCEHAIQLKGNADNIKIKDNDFSNFNAAIKSSGLNNKSGSREYADYAMIHGNTFVNDWPRATKNAVTPIDVVGGDYWIIKRNFFADFEKQRGNKVSYGAFLKGGGRFGEFVDNVVACEWKVPYTSKTHVRIGLSFGGGGTGSQFCADKVCESEHYKGVMQHNLVMNCPTDVGVYINNGAEIVVSNNIIIGTLGLDVNRGSADVEVVNNNIQGLIRWRNESKGIAENNNTATFEDIKRFEVLRLGKLE
jgi:pectate lyase